MDTCIKPILQKVADCARAKVDCGQSLIFAKKIVKRARERKSSGIFAKKIVNLFSEN